jgi:hypothetical protein
MTVQEHFNDLVVATYGRGFWILDDLTPLQQLTPEALGADAHLFPPRPTYRFRDITAQASQSNDPSSGDNPPYGASINYYLKSAPSGDVALAILDPQGRTIRRLRGSKNPGLNRVYWDLEYEPTAQVVLRTSPLYSPDITVGPDGTRTAAAGRLAILAPPGTYTIQMTAAGRQFTQKLEVRKDPTSAGTDADIQKQMTVLTQIAGEIDRATQLINQLELVRSQIYHLARIVADDTSVRRDGDALDKKLIDLELNLIELRSTGRGQDGVRWGSKLHGKLLYLANGLMSGDFGPTNQQLEVQKELEGRLRGIAGELDNLLSRDLGAFNEQLRKRNLPTIVTQVSRSGS